MDRDQKTVTLRHPIEVDGAERSEIAIREPCPKDLEAMDRGKGEVQKANLLLAACAGIPVTSVHKMRMVDYQACMEALESLGFTKDSEEASGSDD